MSDADASSLSLALVFGNGNERIKFWISIPFIFKEYSGVSHPNLSLDLRQIDLPLTFTFIPLDLDLLTHGTVSVGHREDAKEKVSFLYKVFTYV